MAAATLIPVLIIGCALLAALGIPSAAFAQCSRATTWKHHAHRRGARPRSATVRRYPEGR
jgi:hypothetical protein